MARTVALLVCAAALAGCGGTPAPHVDPVATPPPAPAPPPGPVRTIPFLLVAGTIQVIVVQDGPGTDAGVPTEPPPPDANVDVAGRRAWLMDPPPLDGVHGLVFGKPDTHDRWGCCTFAPLLLSGPDATVAYRTSPEGQAKFGVHFGDEVRVDGQGLRKGGSAQRAVDERWTDPAGDVHRFTGNVTVTYVDDWPVDRVLAGRQDWEAEWADWRQVP